MIVRSVKGISFLPNLVVKRRSSQVPPSTLLTSNFVQRGSFRKSRVRFATFVWMAPTVTHICIFPGTRCRVDSHLCGQRCEFAGMPGCVDECVKVTPLSLTLCRRLILQSRSAGRA